MTLPLNKTKQTVKDNMEKTKYKKSNRKVSDLVQKVIILIKERNYYELLDFIVLLIFIAIILFTTVYKISINVESFFWKTNNLVLSDSFKEQLPTLLLFTLISISIIKWVLFVRVKKNKIDKIQESSTITISLKKSVISIKKSTLYTLILIIILSFFTISRIPYWDISFTVNHPLKYNTYVEPALAMYTSEDPFLIQRKYMHNPITNSLGVGTQFGNFPLLEWSLYLFYILFSSFLSIEVITRLVMTLYGCIALLALYNFTKKIFNKELALLAVFLLSINTIFNLASFVTVYDIISFSLTFFSLSILADAVKHNSVKHLLIAGLLIGVGASIKENILLWSIPTASLIIIYNNRSSITHLLSNLAVYLLGVVMPYALVKTSLGKFPMKEPEYFILFFIELFILIIICWKNKVIYSLIKKLSDFLVRSFKKNNWLLITIPLLILLAMKIVYSTSISEEFLTDFRLLTNIQLYLVFISEQLIPYLGIPITIMLGIGAFWFVYHNRIMVHDTIILSVIMGSLVYIVMASKVLYFHSYYWLFILASCIILASWGIYFMIKNFYKGIAKNIYTVLLIISLTMAMTPMVKSKLNREYSEINDVVRYFNSIEIEEGTSYVDQGNTSYLTIKTDLYKIYDYSVFAHRDFRNSVNEIGFIETMKKYKIKYLVTQNSEPDYSIFTYSFLEEDHQTNYLRRTDLILSFLKPKIEYKEDVEEGVSILGKNHIKQQFRLIAQYDSYRIYTLSDACFNTVFE